MVSHATLDAAPKRLPSGDGGLDRHAVFRHALRYLSATYLATALAALRAFINARWLGPELYGLLSSFSFLTSFGFHLHGGVQEAAVKQIPAFRSQGRPDLARQTAQTAATFFAAMLGLAAAACCVVAWRLPEGTERLVRAGWFIMALILPLEVLYFFEQTMTRAEERFHHLSRGLLMPAVLSLGLTGWLVVAYGMSGFYVVAVLTPAIGLWTLRRRASYPWRPVWRWPQIRAMLAIGWPVLAMTLGFEALRWVDRSLILVRVGLEGFGYYGVGLTLMRLCFMFPQIISAVVEPRVHFDFAQSQRPERVREHLWVPLHTLALAMPLGLALLDLLVPLVIPRWLPAYVPGIPVIRLLIWGSFLMGLAGATKPFLVALGQQRRVLPICAVALAANLAASLVLLERGWGLLGIACGTVVGYGVSSIGLVGFAFRRLGWRWRLVVTRTAALYMPCLAIAGFAHLSSRLAMPHVPLAARVLAASGGCLLCGYAVWAAIPRVSSARG